MPGIDDQLIDGLESFRKAWEIYITDQTGGNALTLILRANEAYRFIVAFRATLISVTMTFQAQPPIYANGKPFNLTLDIDGDVRDVISKLSALHSIYARLCNLLEIIEDDYPLQISDIEISSIDIRAYGNALLIGIVEGLIEKSFRHGYDSFLRQAQRQATGFKAEELAKVLNVRQLLRDAGRDASLLDPGIDAAALEIAADLERLAAGVPSVQINTERIDVGSLAEAEYIARSKQTHIESSMPLRLEHKTNDDAVDD